MKKEERRKRINRIVLKLFTDCGRTVENKQSRETNLKLKINQY